MLVLSHRGYHFQQPENTLAAFQAAVELGVDGIETDLRLSADGQVVLYHDRLARDRRPVASLSRDELSRTAGYEVPDLATALDAWPDLLWNLEIKTPVVVDAVLEVLRARTGRRILVSSFWHEVVDAVIEPLRLEGGLLVAHAPAAHVDPREWIPMGSRIDTIVWAHETCSLVAVARCQKAGLKNFVYNDVETPEEAAQLRAWGVTGVIVDRPEICREVVASAG